MLIQDTETIPRMQDQNAACLRICVVGAGLAGIGTAIAAAISGHDVTVYETNNGLSEIGAGLQITPNASRILGQWGVLPEVERAGAEPKSLVVHRYNGPELTREDEFDVNIRHKYGKDAPFIDIHRIDLQKIVYDRAIRLGAKIVFNTKIVRIDHSQSPVQVEQEGGKVTLWDLVVGADGIWSRSLDSLAGHKISPEPTGDLAYRLMLDAKYLPDGMRIRRECHFWIGPRSHAVGYFVRDGMLFNLVLLCPDDLSSHTSRQPGSVAQMKSLFSDWDPLLRQLLDQVGVESSSVDKWRLMHRPELESWINQDGTFALIGDAAHPMLPYLAQGANSALEDAAMLGQVLANVGKAGLATALHKFQKVRKPRTAAIAKHTFVQRHYFHMENGAEQIERDGMLRAGPRMGQDFPSAWTCSNIQRWLYGYQIESSLEAFVD